ncbi:MAG: hypothetical protein IJJ60_03615, partial [Clostridia bacterium]|nr:hypothetical protein [Clostridia bacterium]
FSEYFTAEDGFDGVLDPAAATYDVSKVDSTTVGTYQVKGIFADKAGNEGSAKLNVYVFNPDNTTAPTLTVKEELPTVALDADAYLIDWAGQFVDTAVDTDGLDLKDLVLADLTQIDTTTPGEYPVTLKVADYAGNETSVEIAVSVVAE